ncbi:MAG: sulfotransferase domain-containing protein [Thermoplasmatales archaeon]|nr:sulfotransferase domain-containing protein [Thermoplasmatales archaeon]
MLIVCNGMMRSGSTLQYNLVRCFLENMGAGEGRGYFVKKGLSDDKLEQWVDDDSYHVIKMHEIHPKVIHLSSTDSVFIFYIYRDIRDVAVSAKRKFKCENEEQFIKALDTALAVYYEIKTIPGVLIQKYEDVVRDIPSAIQEYCDVLSIKLTEENIISVVRKCSIDNTIELANKTHNSFTFRMKEFFDRASSLNKNLRALLLRLGMPANMYDKRTLLHRGHISKDKGQSGIWRNNLTELEVEMIENRYGSWLRETGYMA